MCQLLKEKVAIVTSSGRGVGRGIALKLAEQSAAVVVSDTDAAAVDETVSQIKSEGGRAVGVVADVSNWEGVQEVVRASEGLGKVGILVYNAATVADSPVEE